MAQGLNKPGSFQCINMDHGGTHAESFLTLSDDYIDQCFTTHSLLGITHNTEDKDNKHPPYDYSNSSETCEIDMIPPNIQHRLNTLYWCKNMPKTTAWLTSDPSILTMTLYSKEDDLDNIGDHPTYSQMKKHPVLRPMVEEAMETGFVTFTHKEVYKLKPLPAHIPWGAVIPSHWQFTIKCGKDRHILCIKACLVTGGDHQVPGCNFQELYVSTISPNTVCLIIALACKHNLDLLHLDVCWNIHRDMT
jgi:hypothetical protein